MMALNGYYKDNHVSTDVLAFDLAETKKRGYIEAEIYVNLQAARRQSCELGISYAEEAARLCAHGFLHLLGFDDLKAAARKKMWKIQESFVEKLQKKDINGS